MGVEADEEGVEVEEDEEAEEAMGMRILPWID